VLYHRRYSHRRVVSDLAERLTAPLDAGGIALLLATRLEAALAPEEIVVAVRGPGGAFAAAAPDGTLHPWCSGHDAETAADSAGGAPFTPARGALPGRRDWALAAPVDHRGTLLALIALAPRADGVPYVPEDVELLAEAVRIAAPFLANAALSEQRADRERLAAVGSAAAAVAHELKNPLAAIRSTAAILRRRLPEDPRGRELTRVVEDEAERLERSVADVLTFVRPRRSEPEPVDLGELVAQLVAVVRPELRHANVEVELRLPDDAPVVHGDATRLRQAVLNLLLNAQEAMPSGGAVEVELGPWHDGTAHGVEVTVSDSGSGFGDDALEHALEPFFTTKRLGTGLGLANVRRVAEEHGGTVALANRPAGGAVVRLRLPVSDEGRP
jgi:signal transduction histidine kinase